MVDALSEQSVLQNILQQQDSYHSHLQSKDRLDTEKYLADFLPGQCWELAEVSISSNDSSMTLEAIAERHSKIPYIPVATFDSSVKQPLESNQEPPRYLVKNKPFDQGGMGTIYKAFDRKLGIPVAIKSLPDNFWSHVEQRERLEKEAKVMANLDNPYVAKVYAFTEIPQIPGVVHTEIPAMIMEYVDPQTNLWEILNSGKMEPNDVVTCMDQLCSAVDSMARNGLLHRDLKPSNIFWNEQDKYVKVIDFGLASTADNSDGPVGSPQYMSPEHTNDIQTVTLPSEVFSLASITFKMLTGSNRFEGAPYEIILDVYNNDGLIDSGSIRRLRESLKPSGIDLDSLIEVFHIAQRNDPAKRYQTAGEFAQALSKALNSNTARA